VTLEKNPKEDLEDNSRLCGSVGGSRSSRAIWTGGVFGFVRNASVSGGANPGSFSGVASPGGGSSYTVVARASDLEKNLERNAQKDLVGNNRGRDVSMYGDIS